MCFDAPVVHSLRRSMAGFCGSIAATTRKSPAPDQHPPASKRKHIKRGRRLPGKAHRAGKPLGFGGVYLLTVPPGNSKYKCYGWRVVVPSSAVIQKQRRQLW